MIDGGSLKGCIGHPDIYHLIVYPPSVHQVYPSWWHNRTDVNRALVGRRRRGGLGPRGSHILAASRYATYDREIPK